MKEVLNWDLYNIENRVPRKIEVLVEDANNNWHDTDIECQSNEEYIDFVATLLAYLNISGEEIINKLKYRLRLKPEDEYRYLPVYIDEHLYFKIIDDRYLGNHVLGLV